jgi:hypothetical protein
MQVVQHLTYSIYLKFGQLQYNIGVRGSYAPLFIAAHTTQTSTLDR